ncbi:MAG TPA: hypothetical protein EYP17_08930 [Candidatus Latescibacteria bacterium]|nr:hypothetical protein [Candidatus Latescibacterota bacterium]
MRRWTIGTLFLWIPAMVGAQGNTELLDFRGGRYRIKADMALGIGLGLDPPGGGPTDVVGLEPGVAHLFRNPAALAYGEGQVLWTLRPGAGIDLGKFVDLNAQIRPKVDDAIRDFRAPGLKLEDEDYPDIGVQVGLGSLSSWGVGGRYRGLGFAFGVHQPFRMRLLASGSGLEALLRTMDEEPSRRVTFFGTLDLLSRVEGEVVCYGLSAAREVRPGLAVGFGYDVFTGVLRGTMRAQTEGLMVTAGNERAFNDPNDPWQNSLYTYAVGRYEGRRERLRAGVVYRVGPSLSLGASLSLPAELVLSGRLDIEEYTLPALNIGAGEDLMDPTKVDLDEPTKTELVDNPTGREVLIEVPGKLEAGVGGRWGGLLWGAQVAAYLGELSAEYAVEKPEGKDRYRGELDPGFRVGLGLSYRGLVFELGVLSTKLRAFAPEKKEELALMLPELTLGFRFSVGRSIEAGVNLLALPERVGGGGLLYRFPM